MVIDFTIIMLAIAIGAFGGMYLGMRIQTPNKSNSRKTQNIAPQENNVSHVETLTETECVSEMQEQQLHADEEAIVRNAEAVLNDASENAARGKELRKKMRNQDARYCVLKKD